MPTSAPLRSTVRIDLETGSAAGQRRYRLTASVELPPRLLFSGDLPIEGLGRGRVCFGLPSGMVSARAKLYFDPDRPERGSQAELLDLDADQLRMLQTYVEERIET